MPFSRKLFANCLLAGLFVLPASAGKADATPPSQQRGIVIVAESAGGNLYLADSLAQVANQYRLPLGVEVTEWSTLNLTADCHSEYNCTAKSMKLANRVLELHRTRPGARIFLVGNGTGAKVVVRAAESLPAGCVQRIILLGPTMPNGYDLRRCLQSCDAMDVFCCKYDLALELLTQNQTRADQRKPSRTCAGLTGFMPHSYSAHDAALYGKLRQHVARPQAGSDDINFGHLRYLTTNFQRSQIIPLLETSLRMTTVSVQPISPALAPPALRLPPGPPTPPAAPRTGRPQGSTLPQSPSILLPPPRP